jgi:hypothetical protein
MTWSVGRSSDEFAGQIPQLIHPRDPNAKYASFTLPEVPRATRIMEIYGYEPAASAVG